MNDRPPQRFFAIGIASLALMVVGLVLTSQESDQTLSAVLSVVGALGMFACWYIIRRPGRGSAVRIRPPKPLARATITIGVFLLVIAAANTSGLTPFMIVWFIGVLAVIAISVWFLKH